MFPYKDLHTSVNHKNFAFKNKVSFKDVDVPSVDLLVKKFRQLGVICKLHKQPISKSFSSFWLWIYVNKLLVRINVIAGQYPISFLNFSFNVPKFKI